MKTTSDLPSSFYAAQGEEEEDAPLHSPSRLN
jgi:hypothetical protein